MLGRPRRQLTKEEYKLLTALKIESAYKAFSLSQLLERLSTIGKGFWREAAFVPFMVQYGVISKNAYNRYCFDKAFNFEQLKTAVHKYQCKKSKQRIRSKRAAIRVEEEVTVAIPVNPIEERDYESPDRRTVEDFQHILTENGINATIRREMGRDISSACGQLRRKYASKS